MGTQCMLIKYATRNAIFVYREANQGYASTTGCIVIIHMKYIHVSTNKQYIVQLQTFLIEI